MIHYSRNKKGETEGKKCHAQTMMRITASPKADNHRVPLRQNMEQRERGKELKVE
jgi:hypothetical protein